MSTYGKYAKKSSKFEELVNESRLDELEYFVSQQNDNELYSWLGQFFQSLGNNVKASDYYVLAGDDLKLVELKCSQGLFDEALCIVEEGGNAAAAYHLSKFCTGSEAVKLSCFGGLFNRALRVAMAGGLDAELFDISKKCNSQQVSAIARYFETKASYHNACTLYSRCGQTSKALAVCLIALDRTEGDDQKMRGLLVSLVTMLKGSITSETAHKVLNQLEQTGETELMADLLISSKTKDAHTCLQFCVEHGVSMTDEIATNLLSLATEEEFEEVSRALATQCHDQRNHKLACAIYTQLGDRTMALKSLVREGDLNAIIEYANRSEASEIHVLAATYLQKQNLSGDELIEKSIIEFYMRAEKYDKLVSYYISQSQSCVDKDGNYHEALQYLNKASSNSNKLKDVAAKEIKRLIGERVSTMEWFIYAKESLHSIDRLSLENLCNDLLSPQSNRIVRQGDCYALLVNYSLSCEQYHDAYDYLRTMQDQSLDPYQFLDKTVVNKILQGTEREDSFSGEKSV